VVVFYGVLWAEGANDVIAGQFHVPLYTVTWIARVLVIAGPVAAYVIARRICLGLQRKDAETLEHGVETGIIRQSPDGGFTEILRPVSEEERAVLSARQEMPALPAADDNGVPAPAGAGVLARLRVGAHAAFAETAVIAAEPNGHASDGEHHPASGRRDLQAGEPHRESAQDTGR
jgi:ubiquinol-cytochrome c reductase cytochrome b subunit